MARPLSRTLIVLAASGVIAACGSSTTGSTTSSSTVAGGQTAHVVLNHVPTGQATLNYSAGKVTVEVKLTGLAPLSTHPAHIHTGTCAQQGDVLYPLTNIVADAAGTADVTSMVTVTESQIPATGWYVNVHNGPTLGTPEEFLPVACGDVNGGKATVVVPLTMGPGGAKDQQGSGTADLSIVDGQLSVVLTLKGLVPSSMHAAHIHTGSCEREGAVVHGFPDVTADAHGNVSRTITIAGVSSIPTGGWYINVHRGTSAQLSTSTGFDPIICGDIAAS